MLHTTLNFKHFFSKGFLIISLLLSTTLLNANASFPVNDYTPTKNVITKKEQKKKNKLKRFFKRIQKKFTQRTKRTKRTKNSFKTQRQDNYNGTVAMWLVFISIFLSVIVASLYPIAMTIASLCSLGAFLFAIIGIFRDEDPRRAWNILIFYLAVIILAALLVRFGISLGI
jgi:hypothetical protein